MQPCKTCIYSHEVEATRGPVVLGQPATMECHRFPPMVNPILAPGPGGQPHLAGTISVFPTVSVGCGEWHPKNAIKSLERQQ